jgi:hypothetical protein
MSFNSNGPTPSKPVPDTELAWAAGFFDGEGWVGGTRHTSSRSVRIYISQTDRFALDRFRDAVDVGTVHGPLINESNRKRGIGGKPYWAFRAQRRADIKRVYERIGPWLGPLKRRQFAEAIDRLGPDYSKVCRKCGKEKTGTRSDNNSLRCVFCHRAGTQQVHLAGPSGRPLCGLSGLVHGSEHLTVTCLRCLNRGKQTHCKRGHEFTPENTYKWGGKRHCRMCRRTSILKAQSLHRSVASQVDRNRDHTSAA